jgi:hypothetical protein
VSPKKRTSGKRASNRKGLSGNPQRRQQQLRQLPKPETPARPLRNLTSQDRQAFADLAYRLAGGAPAMPWWAQSHERIISQAIARPLPERLVDIETLTGEIVGDEFYERVNSDDLGLAPTQWLRALVEEASARLHAAVPRSTADWPKLWALLCGLTLISPLTAPDAHDDHFPDIRYPNETARAQLGFAVKLLADHGLTPAVAIPEDEWTPGQALVARDAYGSRYLLAVPYAYGETPDAPDHWYAWDVDTCWIATVVSARVFGSAEAALAEWRAAVGATASAAGFAPCRSDLAAWLLNDALRTGPLGEMLQGHEPRELFREYYRLRRRAQVLVDCLPEDDEPADPVIGLEIETGPFLAWHAERYGDAPQPGKLRKATADALETLLGEWGPHEQPDERSLYGCSPHRIEMTGRLVRDEFEPDYATPALQLLPDWVQWCIDRAGIDGDAATAALDAAQAEAANLPDADEKYISPRDEDRAPFRRPELRGTASNMAPARTH